VPVQDAGGLTDPGRQAVLSASYAFSDTGRLAGRPAEAARAAARLEWMAAALPGDQGWIGASPRLFPALRDARGELRAALGLAPEAPAASVSPPLAAAADALATGRRAEAARALDPVAPGGGEAVLARLGALPPLPRAASATRLAADEMIRITQDDPSS
jgi:hypothetical protein